MSAFGGKADIANFKIYGGGKRDVRLDFRSVASRRPAAEGKNRPCTLLPKLLPNAMGQAVTETDVERCGAQVVLTNRYI